MTFDITSIVKEANFPNVVLFVFILVFVGLLKIVNKKEKGYLELLEAMKCLVNKQDIFTGNINELVVGLTQIRVADAGLKENIQVDINEIKSDIKWLRNEVTLIGERTTLCAGDKNEYRDSKN